ncbi:MAG: 3-isopropylmalate dehydratase small subunit [Anaerolineae bacterium]|nr:MAG: 3-isopropylmalate dehydratase small subunit [Anaerolineae bacterium]
MEKFNRLTSHLVPLADKDVDTDQIIPARFLKVVDKEGLGEHLFEDWRTLADGSPNLEFVFNRPEVQGAQILLAGGNFGCGSSREHAPWALLDWGVRAVISTSFADIFRNNALKNGLLPVAVDAEVLSELFGMVDRDPHAEVTIDLASQTVSFGNGHKANFPIDPFAKLSLLEGVDQLGYLLSLEEKISAYEANHDGS